MKINPAEVTKIQKEAESIALKAGKIILKNRNEIHKAIIKSDKWDIKTKVDELSESLIIRQIRKLYPSHTILSEEAGLNDKKSPFAWIIDPLDGTREYVRKMPLFNVSLALEYKKELVIGIIYWPAFNELFSASKNSGFCWNGKKQNVSGIDKVNEAILASRTPPIKTPEHDRNIFLNMLTKLTAESYRVRVFPNDAASLGWVALGSLDAFVTWYIPGIKWWDIAPGILMVKEAGGEVTDFFGKPLDKGAITNGLIASNGKIHQKVLKLVKSALQGVALQN